MWGRPHHIQHAHLLDMRQVSHARKREAFAPPLSLQRIRACTACIGLTSEESL